MIEQEKQYLDSEKDSFDSLPEEEREERTAEAGSLEAAIQQNGLEMALRSMEEPEKEMTPEEQEKFDKMLAGARNVIDAFEIQRSEDGKKGENLTIITDNGADRLFIKALYEAGKEKAGADCRLTVSKKPTGPAQDFGASIGDRIKNSDCILYVTSFSRSHSKETVDLITPEENGRMTPEQKEKMAQWREALQLERGGFAPINSRLISITQTRPEILTDGAAQENLKEMQERLARLEAEMVDAERVKISSKEGTNLDLKIKQGTSMGENGKLNLPGKIANFPFGEWCSSVDLSETNGTLVVDGVSTIPVGELDEPIKLEITNGVVTSIQGGEAAERLRKALDEANAKWREKNPDDKTTDAYRIAELGIGVNSKAFRYKEDGTRIAPPTSLEGEKGLGTIHIAIGKNSIFKVDKSDPDFNPVAVHIDNIINFTTVDAEKKDGSTVRIIEEGEARF